MPDFGAPVAVNVNVNPNQAVQTLSGLLGLKQQKLALETGQYLKETAAAEATAKTVEAQGKQEASGFLKGLDFFKHFGPDGTLDTNAVIATPEFEKLSGPAKEIAANSLLDIKNNQIKNKQDLATLNGSVVAGAARLMGAIATDPDVLEGNEKGFEKVRSQWSLFKSMYPDQGEAFASKFEPHQTPENMRKPGDLAAALRSVQMMGEDVSQQQQQQNPAAVSNAAGQLVNRQPQTGALSAPPGSNSNLNPSAPAVAQAQAAAVGGVQSDVAAYNDIRAAGSTAAAVASLSQQVAQLAHDVDTGVMTSTSSKLWSGLLQRFGYKPTDFKDPGVRRAILGKMAAQLRSQAEAAAPSDAVRQSIDKAFPDPDNMPAGAVIDAARYVHGTALINQARLRNAEAFRKTHGGIVTGLSSQDSGFVQSADPLAAHYASLPDDQKRTFLEQHYKDKNGKIDREAVHRLIQNSNALKYHGAAADQVLGAQ